MRPLDRLPSIKLKLGIVIVAAVAVSAAMSQIGFRLGWPIWLRPIVAAAVSLLMVQFLAHGMTSPLREMADASEDMARGNYKNRVKATSHDEVGDLARAFNSMASNLAELDGERRALVGNAAHELRTPIAGLQATCENLADGIVEATPEVLGRLHTQVDRLSHLVSELLDLSRLESPETPRRVEALDLCGIAKEAVSRAIDEDSGLKVVLDVQPTPPVSGDPDLVARLLNNLLRNAAVHGGANNVRVALAAGASSVVLTVADSGSGFAAEDAAHIFDRFYRGELSRGAGRPGAGLGLAICRTIVTQHGGTISADANHPTGCVITVTFPRQTTNRSANSLEHPTP